MASTPGWSGKIAECTLKMKIVNAKHNVFKKLIILCSYETKPKSKTKCIVVHLKTLLSIFKKQNFENRKLKYQIRELTKFIRVIVTQFIKYNKCWNSQ
jgi:hypothetical protein